MAAVADPLRFTAALTDGRNVWAFRWAADASRRPIGGRMDRLIVVSSRSTASRRLARDPGGRCLIARVWAAARVEELICWYRHGLCGAPIRV
jgi:glutamine amidotransferase